MVRLTKISQPEGKKSLKLTGISLCRYLGRKVKCKLSGNNCIPGTGVRMTDVLVDSSNVGK